MTRASSGSQTASASGRCSIASTRRATEAAVSRWSSMPCPSRPEGTAASPRKSSDVRAKLSPEPGGQDVRRITLNPPLELEGDDPMVQLAAPDLCEPRQDSQHRPVAGQD